VIAYIYVGDRIALSEADWDTIVAAEIVGRRVLMRDPFLPTRIEIDRLARHVPVPDSGAALTYEIVRTSQPGFPHPEAPTGYVAVLFRFERRSLTQAGESSPKTRWVFVPD
jgi:hypothetical protein